MGKLIIIIMSTVLVNNFVLARIIGICPFLGVSKKTETAVGMGMAVIFVITLAASVTWTLFTYILAPLNITYMQTIVFILVIAVLVQFVEMVIMKTSPALYQALGIYLPLITTNCCVLAVSVITVQLSYTFIETVVFALGTSVGFTLALILFAGIRERLSLSEIPKSFEGTAIALITAGLLSLAFLGFSGLVK
ncbi:electron transport complex subunit RsxA [bacterium]|nr:electron transport complex subunit RsxA [bacterium]